MHNQKWPTGPGVSVLTILTACELLGVESPFEGRSPRGRRPGRGVVELGLAVVAGLAV